MKIQIDKQKLGELISNNWKRKEIAEFFQVSEKTISKRIKEYGLSFKKETKQKENFICQTCGKQYYQSKYHPFCCKQCAGEINTEIFVEPTTELGKKIVELRSQGKTYKEIIEELNCSKATISYYCSPQSKEKKKIYNNEVYNQDIKKLVSHVSDFLNRKIKEKIRFDNSDYKSSFKVRVSNFINNWERSTHMKSEKRYGYQEVLDHIGGWETTCYLTGRPLNLKEDEYELDHIIPISKGGSCDLDNLGITCKQANQSKSNMTIEEYIQLCKEVLEHFGYKVEK